MLLYTYTSKLRPVLLNKFWGSCSRLYYSSSSMSAKCYAKGSTSPPARQAGAFRLYSMRFCPYVKRVHLVLAAKKIPYETVNINLAEKPEWYTDMYPSGKVPVLEGDGVFLSESLIICDYLDEAFPGDNLNPADAYQKAKDRMLLETTFSKVTGAILKVFHSPEKTQEACNDARLAFPELEKELKKRNTTFFGGNKPSMLDLMMLPWFDAFRLCYDLMGEESPIIAKEKCPILTHWMEEIRKHPAVSETEDDKNLRAFYENREAGKRDYDVGL